MFLKLKLKFWLFIARALIRPIDSGVDAGTSYAEQMLKNVMDRPYNHLHGYMYRYWVIRHPVRPGEGADHEIGTFRNALRYLYPFYARFHHMVRGDLDRHLHDHPFEFTSLILAGGYTEEVLMPDGTIQTFEYKAGDINHKARGVYHRITEVSSKGVLTLVIMGRRHKHSWGFMVDGEHVDHRQYLNIDTPRVDDDMLFVSDVVVNVCAGITMGVLLTAFLYFIMGN